MGWLERAPLTVIGVLILGCLLLAVEAGYRGHRWLARRRQGDDTMEDGQSHLLSAVLGLLALLLGFTFSLSLSRYEARRDMVLQEANAIGTAALQAELLGEPNRTAMADLLRDYVAVRLVWSRSGVPSPDLTATNALQHKLWTATGVAIRTDPSPQLTRGLMDAVNESFDLAAARTTAREAHIPDRVLHVLLLYTLLSAVMIGYMLAVSGRPHRAATVLMLILLTLALVVILDLDRPRSGAIQVSQQPMEDLQASLLGAR